MPRRRSRTPSYRLHKPSGQAVVTLGGKDHYLGRFGSATSQAEYDRLVAEWLSSGRARVPEEVPTQEPAQRLTVNELILAYWNYADEHYRAPTGKQTAELNNMRDALRHLRGLYGSTPADEFGPLALRAVRDDMVRSGLARTTINARINRIRRAFRWAASVELIPPSVVQALNTVPGLQKGRTKARETDGVGPVPIEHVEATLPFLPKPVAAMVRLQLLTGCRAGEILIIRGCDLTVGDPNWEYRPPVHKNAWRGQERVILLGPKAISIVREFQQSDPNAYLFSPRRTVKDLHTRRSTQRRSRATPSEKAKRAKDAGQKHRACYDRRSYLQAIVRGCKKAGVPGWSPLQPRHTAATLIRKEYGLEVAQIVLGHARADVTQVYAERDLAKAQAVMAQIG